MKKIFFTLFFLSSAAQAACHIVPSGDILVPRNPNGSAPDMFNSTSMSFQAKDCFPFYDQDNSLEYEWSISGSADQQALPGEGPSTSVSFGGFTKKHDIFTARVIVREVGECPIFGCSASNITFQFGTAERLKDIDVKQSLCRQATTRTDFFETELRAYAALSVPYPEPPNPDPSKKTKLVKDYTSLYFGSSPTGGLSFTTQGDDSATTKVLLQSNNYAPTPKTYQIDAIRVYNTGSFSNTLSKSVTVSCKVPPRECGGNSSCMDDPPINDLGQSTNTQQGCDVAAQCQAKVAEPVNVSSGAMWHEMQDFVLPGKNAASTIDFRRMYTANPAGSPGDFGPNWQHSYETKLITSLSLTQKNILFRDKKRSFAAGYDALWIDENGGPWIFKKGQGEEFVPPPGMKAKLVIEGDFLVLTKPNRTKLYFNRLYGNGAAGALAKIEEPHGEKIEFFYLGSQELDRIESSMSGVVRFYRNDEGRVRQITRERDNLNYFYEYDEAGRLFSSTDFDGKRYEYTYITNQPNTAAQGMLAKIRDPLGREIEFSYYDDGRAKKQITPGGGVWQFRYGKQRTQVRSPDNELTTHYYDAYGRVTRTQYSDGAKFLTKWNAAGFKAAEGYEAAGVTEYGYDANGNVTSVKRPADTTATLITYDQTFNKPLSIIPPMGAPTMNLPEEK